MQKQAGESTINLDDSLLLLTLTSLTPQTFEQLPAAKYQDWQLYERHHKKKDYLQLPQSLLTFLLRHLHEEILRPPQPTSAIYLTFGSKVSQ